MKMMLSLCVCVSVMAALAAASDVKECPGLTEDKLAELKKLVFTENIHDQLVGDFTEVWGMQQVLEKDENTCVKTSIQRVDDNLLSATGHLKGEWFGGEKTRNFTFEKIDNGVYYVKKSSGDVKAKMYALYAKNYVYAFYTCKFCGAHSSSDETKKPEVTKGEEKKNKLPFWTTISIRSVDLKTPLDEEVQKSVKEAVALIQEHKELLGDIAEYPHPC